MYCHFAKSVIKMSKYPFLNNALIKVEEIKKHFASEAALFSALKRLSDRGEIVKLKGGLYATVNPLSQDIYANRFEIATALYDGAYCAYHTALEYHGLATQVYSDVHAVTEKRYSPMVIDGLEYQFFQSSYDGGIIETKRNATIRVSELERTVIDCLDRVLLSGGIEEVFSALSMTNYCDEEKLLKHLSGYKKKILYKKAGYFFSRLKPPYLTASFYEECKRNMSRCDDDVRENKKNAYIYDKEWRLYVPKYLINTEN